MATSKVFHSRQRKESENGCPVCHERLDIYAVGRCDHAVCYRCATRMRVLCDQQYCAICRSDLQKLLFLRRPRKFDSVSTTTFCLNRQFMIFFEDSNIDEKFHRLLESRCKICPPTTELFEDFNTLRKHMQREHLMFYCDLCVNHLKLFSVDRKYYNRQQLAQHRRHGDPDDKSYKGHPLCKFCDEHYFDNDELLKHLRKDHFYCHICETNGITNEFFGEYETLRDHFKAEHILCEEGSCSSAKFENVFRSDIDYRAHWTQHHSSGAARQHVRQMRTIDIDVNFTRRQTGGGIEGGTGTSRRGACRHQQPAANESSLAAAAAVNGRQSAGQRREAQRKRMEEIDVAHALSASLADVRQGHVSIIDARLAAHTDSLAARPHTASSQQPQGKAQLFEGRSEDFPTLGQQPAVVDTNSEDSSKAATAVCGPVSGSSCAEPSLSLAKKLALSSKFSVGTGSLGSDEFPSLPSTSLTQSLHRPATTAGRPKSQQALSTTSESDFPALSTRHFAPTRAKGTTAVEAQSAWTNSKQQQSQAPVRSVNKSDSRREVDYPSLASQASKKPTVLTVNNTMSSLADISRSFSSGSLSAMVTDPAVSDPGANWGPGLYGKAIDGTKHTAKQQNNARGKGRQKTADQLAQNASKSDQPIINLTQQTSQNVDEHSGNVENKAESSVDSGCWVEVKVATDKADGRKKTSSVKSSKVEESNGKPKPEKMVLMSSAKENSKSQLKKTELKGKGLARTSAGLETENKSVSKTKELKNGQENLQNKQKQPKKENVKGKAYTGDTDVVTSIEGAKGVTMSQPSSVPVIESDLVEEMCQVSQVKKRKESLDIGNTDKHTVKTDTSAISKSTTMNDTQLDVQGRLHQQDSDSLPASNFVQESSVFCPDDFPSLVKLPVSAPPGFSVPLATKPPPGFSSVVAVSAVRPPPGLCPAPPADLTNKTPVTSSAVSVAPSTKADLSLHFIAPSDMKERYMRLIQIISSSVTDANMNLFRQLSADFRLGILSATDYLQHCHSIIDSTNFSLVFPELIALLPDIPKQQDLLKAHRDFAGSSGKRYTGGGWSGPVEDGLVSCIVCGQILKLADQCNHDMAHDLDFPSLAVPPC